MAPSPLPPSGRRHLRIAARCRSVADLRLAARRRLPRGVFDFIDGGSEDERSLSGNSAAFDLFRFRPHTLVDVRDVDTKATILGQGAGMPLIAGPTGAAGFSWPRGDLAVAGAAGRAGIPYALSTSASVSIEDIAAAHDGQRWFQCYIFKQREVTHRLIERARTHGYDTLVITVDFPVGGNRERDHRNDFSVPFSYTPRNVMDFARHPRWALSNLRHGTPELANLMGFDGAKNVGQAASSVGRNYDAGFAWRDLRAIRDLWPGKLIVKGIARADDAVRLVELGADAIVVSNHGGRQLDRAFPTLLCLPSVAAAVNGRSQVFVDGGIRRGSHVVTALALGADAVLIGRPMIWGIAAAGPAGADRVLGIMKQELTRVMQLCGVTRLDRITPDLIAAEDLARQFDTPTLEWLRGRGEAAQDPTHTQRGQL